MQQVTSFQIPSRPVLLTNAWLIIDASTDFYCTYLNLTWRWKRLLTAGGWPLLATHRYPPACSLVTCSVQFEDFVLEAHYVYHTVSSWFLIKFAMGGGGGRAARAGRLNYFMHLLPHHPRPTVWALKPPSWALVQKTTSAPMIYTALCIMFWMRAYCISITWASGRGLGPGNLKFSGPQMGLAYRLDAISQGPKNSRFPGQIGQFLFWLWPYN